MLFMQHWEKGHSGQPGGFFLNQNVGPLNPGITYSDLDKPPFQSYVIELDHQSPGIDPPGLLGRS
jgi:hypothetical protein